MESTRILWCTLRARPVEVSVRPRRTPGAAVPGLSPGLEVSGCVDKDPACYGTGCPFTTDGGACPFGDIGEAPDGPPERFDAGADPSFEGEWE